MGVSERKERDRQDMKKAILRTAKKMYLKDGFENLSIRAIANHMEYSVGTMYLYYKNRAELINALMEEGFNKLNKAFQTVKKNDDALVYLECVMLKYLDFAIKNPEYYDLMFIMSKPKDISMDEKDWKRGLESFKVLADIVNLCIEQKLLRYEDPKLASLHIWSFLHGLAALYLKNHLLPLGIPEYSTLKESARQFLLAIKS